MRIPGNFNWSTQTILIASLMIALALIAGVIGGTYALFHDAESAGNQITAGTLDLSATVDGSYSGDVTKYTVTPGGNGINGCVKFENIMPDDAGTFEWVLVNHGTIPGVLTISCDCTFSENGVTEPESFIPANNSGGNGDLDEYLMITLQRGVGEDRQSALADMIYILGTSSAAAPAGSLESVLDSEEVLMGASGGNDTIVYFLTWSLPDDVLINIVQSDTAEIDITFSLSQIEPDNGN